jgi:hypothetical protein
VEESVLHNGPAGTLLGSLVWGLAALAGACLLPRPVVAALGAPYDSIATDQARLEASMKVTPRSLYEVHELTLASGTHVREYASNGGTVFAVAWSGPTMPNLQQTLGGYFADYKAAARAKHGGHNHLAVRQDNLVIQASGHMRAFAGRAYLPQAIPPGVSIDELR